ncbi:MAG: ATP-binding protein, partial [Bdellovibrionota bacterium]
TGTNSGNRRVFSAHEPEIAPKRWQITESSARLLELAAAGAHHALLLASSSAEVEEFSAILALLLPPVEGPGREEWQYFRRVRGNTALTLDPGKKSEAGKGNSVFRKTQNLAEQLLFAKNGVIYANNIVSGEAKTALSLFQWMETGSLTWQSLGHSFSEPLDANVVAWAIPCECGGRYYGSCSCRTLELQKYRMKLERAIAGPFDIRFCLPVLAEKRELDLKLVSERIKAAQGLMKARQARSNGALSLNESLSVKRWSSKAMLLLRSLNKEASLNSKSETALARIALTVSDLEGRDEVGEQDLLEARHYSFFG